MSDAMKGQGAALRELAERYWRMSCEESPFAAILAGEATPGGVLFREAPADHDRRRARAADLLEDMSRVSGRGLDDDERVTRRLLERELGLICDLHEVKAHLRPSLYPVGPDFNVVFYANATRLGGRAAAAEYVERLASVPGFLDDIRACLDEGVAEGFRTPAFLLERAAAAVRANLPDDPAASALMGPFARAGASRQGLAEAEASARRLLEKEIFPALAAYADHVDGLRGRAARDEIACTADPLGEDYYALLVRQYTSLDTTPEAVHALGLEEVRRLEAEIADVAAKAGHAGDVAGYRAWLENDPAFYAPGREAHLQSVRALCKRIDRELPAWFATLPRITYGVDAIPEALAESLPPAYAQPSPADNSSPGVFWVTSLVEKCPNWLYLSLALHEAWPGHLMQIARMQEQTQLPKFRRNGAVKYTACIEGWAMYCETLGIEMGLYTTPHEHFGRLNMEMWRAVRLVVDTGIHARGWSRQRALEYMAARVVLPKATVEAEIDRYVGLPGQALAYQPGNLKFRELRRRAEQALGEAFDVRRYHDAVIAVGPVTLEVLDEYVDGWIAQQAREAA